MAQARSSALLGRIIDMLFEHPAITVPYMAGKLNITYNAAKNNIERLVGHKILTESSGYGRPKMMVAKDILNLINE